MVLFRWVCDDNLKIACEHILFLFYLKSGVCCFCPIEKSCDGVHVTVKAKLKAKFV